MDTTKRVSKRQARKLLVHKERLRALMSKTYEGANRWYFATLELGVPGSGAIALGVVEDIRLSAPEGQRSYVRWHDGTLALTWFPNQQIPVGSWVRVRTQWNPTMGNWWDEERVMRVVEMLDTMPPAVPIDHDAYWRTSRELDDLEMANLLMIAPATETPEIYRQIADVASTDADVATTHDLEDHG